MVEARHQTGARVVTPEEWQRAKEILAAAILQPAGERSRHIAELCGADVRLSREIEDLLANYDDDPSIAALIREEVPPPVSGVESPFDGSLSSTRTAPPHEAIAVRGEGGVVTWGEYTLLDEIGRGGFGVVHRAWDGSLKRDIALKVIDVRKVSHVSEDTVLREGQMLARVRHPNVVTVYSARRIGREVGLAMEYIKGRTLSTLIVQQGVLNAHEAVHYGLALCDALAAVHREGLVHRDLKASNVMREEGGRIVLMDFGAGREVMREPGTWSGLIGTPAYMPPEVLRGERATPTADIYSLGILLFHLVTGRYPVAGGSFGDVVRAHATSERLALAECRADLPRAFVDAVERAMQPQADKRPQTAAALKRELDACLRLPDPVDHSSQAQQTIRVPAPRSSVLQRSVAAVGGIVLLCAAAGIVTTLQFDTLLGREGEFASETPLAYVSWGVQAMLGPA
ncbi:MAG: serine/threonine-protein kinase, partial [Burkholderiales bacterium]